MVNYGLDNVRFVTPVRAGQRVRNHITLAAVKARSNGRYFVTTDNSIEIEGEKRPALTASALAIFIGDLPEPQSAAAARGLKLLVGDGQLHHRGAVVAGVPKRRISQERNSAIAVSARPSGCVVR